MTNNGRLDRGNLPPLVILIAAEMDEDGKLHVCASPVRRLRLISDLYTNAWTLKTGALKTPVQYIKIIYLTGRCCPAARCLAGMFDVLPQSVTGPGRYADY